MKYDSRAFSAIFLLVVFGMTSAAGYTAAPVVAIDVGHTIAAPGATSARGISEFRFNADLAQVLRDALVFRRGRVVMIGDKGDMSDLQRRTAVAAASAATFFLSVHHDSVQPQYLASWDWRGSAVRYSDRFSGFSLFVSRKNPALDASLRCASAIGAALRRAGLQPSSHHAENISGENKEWADERNGVYYYDNLAVLRSAVMPAVLLEAGIIVNRGEEERLQQPAMRSTIANAVAEGLAECGAIE